MAIDTAESAVADNVSISRLLEFERVLALAGDRGFCFESGDLKINMFPAPKASSPPGAKGSWRQPVAAAAATKAPKKHRAAKHALIFTYLLPTLTFTQFKYTYQRYHSPNILLTGRRARD